MKNLRYDRASDDLGGIVLRKVVDGEELYLDVDEALLAELDRLLELRESAAPADEAAPGEMPTTAKAEPTSARPRKRGSRGGRGRKAGGADRAEADDASGAAGTSPPSERLETVPKNAKDAIAAAKSWIPAAEGRRSDLALAEAVTENLKARMLQLPPAIFDASWSAERRKGGGWIVTFDFLLGGQPRTAEWIVDDVKRLVRAGNQSAEELEFFDAEHPPGASARAKTRLGRRRRA